MNEKSRRILLVLLVTNQPQFISFKYNIFEFFHIVLAILNRD